MSILKPINTIAIEDRDIDLFFNQQADHQMGHVVIRPRDQMSMNFLSHQEDEYLYLIKGTLTVKTYDHVWEIKPGEFNLIPKGTMHILENISDEVGEFVFFNIKPFVRQGG